MELIDDWIGNERVASKPAAAVPPATAQAFHAALKGFDPQPLSLHCYEDVGYPWMQISFEFLISPDVALRVAQLLAAVPGAGSVYFNSLRPRAVYFLVEPGFEPPPDLPATRYGVALGATGIGGAISTGHGKW